MILRIIRKRALLHDPAGLLGIRAAGRAGGPGEDAPA
jgi:hypothetical protein